MCTSRAVLRQMPPPPPGMAVRCQQSMLQLPVPLSYPARRLRLQEVLLGNAIRIWIDTRVYRVDAQAHHQGG